MTDDRTPAPCFARVKKTLRPGQPGTVKLQRRYGGRLVCVRYREDAPGERRCTTVELIIEEGPVLPRISDRTIVEVEMPWHDRHTWNRARTLGARWDPQHRRWTMSYKMSKALGLKCKVLED